MDTIISFDSETPLVETSRINQTIDKMHARARLIEELESNAAGSGEMSKREAKALKRRIYFQKRGLGRMIAYVRGYARRVFEEKDTSMAEVFKLLGTHLPTYLKVLKPDPNSIGFDWFIKNGLSNEIEKRFESLDGTPILKEMKERVMHQQSGWEDRIAAICFALLFTDGDGEASKKDLTDKMIAHAEDRVTKDIMRAMLGYDVVIPRTVISKVSGCNSLKVAEQALRELANGSIPPAKQEDAVDKATEAVMQMAKIQRSMPVDYAMLAAQVLAAQSAGESGEDIKIPPEFNKLLSDEEQTFVIDCHNMAFSSRTAAPGALGDMASVPSASTSYFRF